MSIVFSPGLVIGAALQFPLSHPMVGWHNQVAFNNVTAESAAAGHPATNLANPSTANRWLSASTAEQLVTVTDLDGQTDYVGIARHNFGSAGVIVSVEAITGEPGAVWETIHPGLLPANDGPIMLPFEPGFHIGVRLRLVPDAIAPSMAVLFVGKSLVLQRSMQAGFTPITDARENDLVTGWAHAGELLGAIIEGSSSSNNAEIKALEPAWYREAMAPFVDAGNAGEPFFFAWDPEHHPDEVGFCTFANGKVRPVINYLAGHEIDIMIPMNAVSL